MSTGVANLQVDLNGCNRKWLCVIREGDKVNIFTLYFF